MVRIGYFLALLSLLAPTAAYSQNAAAGPYVSASVGSAVLRWGCEFGGCGSLRTDGVITATAQIGVGLSETTGIALGAAYWRARGDPYETVGLALLIWPTRSVFVAGSLDMVIYESQPFFRLEGASQAGITDVTELGPAWGLRAGVYLPLGVHVSAGPYFAYARTIGAIQEPFGFDLAQIGLALRVR